MRYYNFGSLLGLFVILAGIFGALIHGIFHVPMDSSVVVGMVLSVAAIYFGHIKPRRA